MTEQQPAYPQVVLTNTESLPGYRIKHILGLVQGNTVRAKHFGRDFAAGLKNLVGGELSGYTELLIESRQQATQRMVHQATQLGANAVINVRFSTSAVTGGAAELYAYGTAVVIEAEGTA
ncbi:MAG: YbjQ family protein [Planctomycetota bacterium]